jgi:hypothetical protein
MPKLVSEIIKSFEDHMGREAKMSNTPGTPGSTLPKATEDEQPLNESKYRSIVGKIMYLVTKVMVEGSNAARELAKHFQKPTEPHWKELERFVGYLKKMNGDVKLTYRKPRELRPVAMVDSNYATNTDDRRSVTGAIYTLGGSITNWISKTQPSVSLSSAESEYYAASTASQELRFTQMLLAEIATCEYPAIMYEDNTGCIFLIKNQQVGQRTKHIAVRAHFIRELWSRGLLDVRFVRSEENESDICTKNTTEKINNEHAPNIRNGTMYFWRKWKNSNKKENVQIALREDVKIDDSWHTVRHRKTVRRKSRSSQSSVKRRKDRRR